MGYIELLHPITLNPGSLKVSSVDNVPNLAHNEPYESQSLFFWGKAAAQGSLYSLTTSVVQTLIMNKRLKYALF